MQINRLIEKMNIHLKKEKNEDDEMWKQDLEENYEYYRLTKKIPIKAYKYIFKVICFMDVSTDKKNKLAECFDEEFKRHLLNDYISEILPNRNEVQPVFDDEYNIPALFPRINNVPLRFYFKNRNKIVSESCYADIKLLGYTLMDDDTNDKNKLIALKYLFEEDDFFKGNWQTRHVKELMLKTANQELLDFINDTINNNDRLLIEEINSKSLIKHKFEINSNLEARLLSAIPEKFSLLEKSIYLYHLLCVTFSYDPIFYIDYKNKKYRKEFHYNVSNIPHFSQENNRIVCYEFIYIYSVLLRKLGITKINEHIFIRWDKFRNFHAYLEFLVDGVIVHADSSTGNKGYDLATGKFSDKLNYIYCTQYNKETRKIFSNAMQNVERYIRKTEHLSEFYFPNKQFVLLLDIKTRLNIFNKYIIDNDFKGVELYYYVKNMIKYLNLEELMKCIFYRENNVNYIEIIFKQSQYDVNIDDNSVLDFRYKIDSDSKEIIVPNDLFKSKNEGMNRKK